MLPTSNTLLIRLRDSSDNEAWSEFDQTYRPFISSVVRKWRFSEVDVEEIEQEVMFTLIQELPNFLRQREGSFRRWLRETAFNRMRQARRKWRTNRLEFTERIEELSKQLNDPKSDLSKLWDDEYESFVQKKAIESVRSEYTRETEDDSQTKQIKKWRIFQQLLDEIAPATIAKEFDVGIATVYRYWTEITGKIREVAATLSD